MNDWKQNIIELINEIRELRKMHSELESRVQRLEQISHDSAPKPKSHQPTAQRLNCWEFNKCGREIGGKKIHELGICPASQTKKHVGINSGKKGGRVCWVLAGTLCEGKVQGIFAEKISTCKECDFYNYVRLQEGPDFRYALPSKEG